MVKTQQLLEGTQAMIVQAQDAAGNVGSSAAAAARIDNTPPGRVDAALVGGEQWRNRNEYEVSWVNPVETDRAPITAASYVLCPIRPGTCTRAVAGGPDLSQLDVRVPAQGEFRLLLWRRDAAGNESEAAASVPITLRYDGEPPQLAFERQPASDPTLVIAPVTERVSGLAGGAIQISRMGSNTWQTLPTVNDGGRLVARIDDALMPAGVYQLRASARDQAGNVGSTSQRGDGQPMVVMLPLRIGSRMKVAVRYRRVVWRTVRRDGKRRRVPRHVTVMRPSARVGFGRHVKVVGQLANRDWQGIAGADVRVFARSIGSAEQLVGVVQTDGHGRFTYAATAAKSRALRFAYGGSTLVLPTQRQVNLRVRAATSLRVSRRRVLNGQAVTFRGTVRSTPLPRAGKLVELQVRLSDRWQTFRTTRTDDSGRWLVRYRFKRTRGVQRYRFRASLPREASYPFEPGRSQPLTVRVRGRG
jgi:5-hydroxyisourate hydrolase-like protein (transthyretin family)